MQTGVHNLRAREYKSKWTMSETCIQLILLEDQLTHRKHRPASTDDNYQGPDILDIAY